MSWRNPARAAARSHAPRRPLAPRRSLACRLLAVAVVIGVGAAVPTFVSAQESAAERAAREIREARERARAAAEAYFEAESTLDLLELEIEGLEADEAQLRLRVDQLRRDVERVALGRYVSSGTEGIPLLTDVSEPQDQVQASVFSDVLTNTGADTLDQFDAANKALVETREEIADRLAEVEARQLLFAELESQANDEVARLREIEEERLQDEAVQRALEAQLAQERAELEERLRLEAEAAARAQPNPGLTTTTTTEAPPTTASAGTVPPDPDDEIDPSDASDASDPSDPSDPDAPAAATSTTTTTTTTPPPVTTLPPNTGESGGTSGGRTGASGGGSNPVGVDTNSGYIDNILCPINGSAYADTWGAPRSGGRRHEGVDMIAPTGVPLFAVVSGVVTFKQNRLGGNAVSLVGDNGNRYYYAHLSAYEGPSGRRVTQGETIGYNGNTGNSSTPHLHLQIHPGGGQAVNPYPSVRLACG